MGPPLRIGRDAAPRSEAVAAVVANAVPLVGVVAFNWTVSALVLLYWLELGILSALALVRATFAGRPSEFDGNPAIVGALESRRVSLSLPLTDVGVRLSTLPVLASAVPLLTLVWLFAGAITVGVLGTVPAADRLGLVVLGAVGVLVSESVRTLLNYFHRREYREHSAQSAIQGVVVRGFAFAMGGLAIVMSVAIVSDSVATDEPIGALEASVVGTPLLVGLVLAKFGFDLASVYRDRLTAFDEDTSVLLGWAYEPPTEETVDTALSATVSQVYPTVRGRVFGGVARIREHPGLAVVGVPILLVGLVFALGEAWLFAGLVVVAAVAVPLGLASLDAWLRYGAVEYRTDGEAIVAIDRLFRTPLWRLEAWDETDLRIERDPVDCRLGTESIVVDLPTDEERRLPWLRDPAPLLEVFDRQPDRPEAKRAAQSEASL